ncbi:MAG: aspartate carbamoyltransferase [Oscillospiraceae bacterium]|nr:aspartate carbamoyltransferase [Oscillospiraceae bacterium]
MFSEFPHLIDLNDHPVSWWNGLLELGENILRNPALYANSCKGKLMGTLFYEPSTRTQMSFQTAMLRLGGTVIGFDNPATSSVAKGENLKDTTKIVSGYADVIVMRHPIAGAAKAAALTADCPVINAGDGGHLHPTQTLTDLLTLKVEKKRLSGLTIGLCGDLYNGRTVHSLCKAMSCYPDNHFIMISTKELRMPSYIKDAIRAGGGTFEETESLEEVMDKLDVLYMTRIQKERFASEEEYLAQKDTYILTPKKMQLAKKDMIVMHPLPRVDEITVSVDDDPRAMYFKQAKYGMYIRMALILTMLQSTARTQLLRGREHPGVTCQNPKCITNFEAYLPKRFTGEGTTLTCEYCDHGLLLKH